MNSNVYPLSPPLLEFEAFGKIPRLGNMVITEKIDGTNAAVGIMAVTPAMEGHPDLQAPAVTLYDMHNEAGIRERWMVYAQSRKRLISTHDDNYGFAAWVAANAATLIEDLGPGLHFGEWWGAGVQRGYGQRHKIFSLFNTSRWLPREVWFKTPNLSVVPLLKVHAFDTKVIDETLADLMENGSYAAPGHPAEGIVIYLPASNQLFKKTERDIPKSVAAELDVPAAA